MGAALSLPTTVPPSGSRAFTLSLNADMGGSFGGTASLLSSDAENSPFTLALSGTVTADLPPTVRITAPQEGTSVVIGSPVPLMATASDDGMVEWVGFFAMDAFGGTYSLGTGLADGMGDYALDLDTARLPAGVYLLQAQAYDDRGQSTTSDPVRLTVTAVTGDFGITPSPVSINAPAGGSSQDAIQLTPTDGFVGAVHLTVTGGSGILGSPGDPTKISASFGSATVNLDGTNTATSTLTLAAGAQVLPGTYSLQITGTDNSGTRVHSSTLSVTIASILTRINVVPHVAIVQMGTTRRFTATALNQIGVALDPQPSFTWAVSGGGTIDGNGLFTAGNTVGGPFTVTAQSGAVSGAASLTVTDVPPLNAPTDLAVYATGSGKVTLYWRGVPQAAGYHIYRGTVAGGEDYAHPVNGTTPVTTLDTGPGVINMFMYSDTNGLTDGTEYFYTVEAVNGTAKSEPSNEDSDVPNPNAVPWDSGDPVQIIAKVNATAANDLEPDIDEDTGDQYPADVGFLNVAAPDGVVYLGNFPDGSAPQAYASSGHFDAASGMIANNDGTFMAAPGDSATTSTDNASMTSMSSPMASASTVADGFPYLPTSPPSGIYREVQAQPGYWGTSATIGLPDASSGSGQVNLVGGDNAYIYLGGSVSYPTGVFPAGIRAPDFQLDAGFQLSEYPCPNQQWVPYVGGHNPGDPIINGGAVTPSGSGWYTYISGEIRTQFLTPNFSSVPDKTIKLHFSVPVGGIGTGKIIVAQTQGIDPDHCPHRISSFSAYSVTLVYAHVRGWRKSQHNAVHPEAGNNRFILKRINSIAQTLNPANYNAATDTPHSAHPGAPLANGPSEYNSKGFLMDGSYVQAFGGGSFSGAYWGYSDTFGIELYSPGRGWSSWTDDPSVTLHAGAYPIGLPYVTWVEQNPFYWETNVALRTTH